MLIAIWAEDAKGLIGKEGTLPWHLPNDLKFFREKTLAQVIVMGRTTFDGFGGKTLPKRTTVVLTSNQNLEVPEGVLVKNSVEEVIALEKSLNTDVYIVGGSKVYESFMPYIDKIYRTKIHHAFEGDTWMPEIDATQFECVEKIEGIVDEKNQYPHTFETYTRR